jgi:hypothetical protein
MPPLSGLSPADAEASLIVLLEHYTEVMKEKIRSVPQAQAEAAEAAAPSHDPQ